MDQLAEFADWLRERAAKAGYDPDSRGGIAALAKAAGTDRGQTGRALRGEVRPSIESQRAWTDALRKKGVDVSLREMLIRSGTLRADDLPQEGEAAPPPAAQLDLFAVANAFGVPEGRAPLFVAAVEAVAKTFADEPKTATEESEEASVSASQTGGLSAKR